MPTKHILKKHLSHLPCRFILGIIGPSKELSFEMYNELHFAVLGEFGKVEKILHRQLLVNPPEIYYREMGEQNLSTLMMILEQPGAYSDLNYLKRKSMNVEEIFSNSQGDRMFNINPGAVGNYGLCLSSHKPTGGRLESFRWSLVSLLGPINPFEPDVYYERIAKWNGNSLELTEKVKEGNLFPEYTETSRVLKFEELVRTLPKSETSVELMADRYSLQ